MVRPEFEEPRWRALRIDFDDLPPLVILAQMGDEDAKTLVVRASMNILFQWINKYPVVFREDLEQEAALGIMKALDTFQVSKGGIWIKHAEQWGRAMIQQFFYRLHRTAHHPVADPTGIAEPFRGPGPKRCRYCTKAGKWVCDTCQRRIARNGRCMGCGFPFYKTRDCPGCVD